MARYLRQLGTGTIYQWTPILAAKKDMVPLDAKSAEKRLSAIKRQLATRKMPDPEGQKVIQNELEHLKGLTAELTEAEAELEKEKIVQAKDFEKTVAKDEKQALTEEEEREKRFAEDPHIIKFEKMSKNELTDYMLAEFGLDVPLDKKMKQVKAEAVELRK